MIDGKEHRQAAGGAKGSCSVPGGVAVRRFSAGLWLSRAGISVAVLSACVLLAAGPGGAVAPAEPSSSAASGAPQPSAPDPALEEQARLVNQPRPAIDPAPGATPQVVPRRKPEAAKPVPKVAPKTAASAEKSPEPTLPLAKIAQATAKRIGVDPHLVHAVILAESAYNPKALSHKGAMGLMQLIPKTAQRYGVTDPWNPSQNIKGGVTYLRDLLQRFDDIELTLAAYNAGEEAVERYGRTIPPFDETQTYVARATSFLDKLKAGETVDKLKRTGSGISGGGLSGWGVIFGSFHDRKEAKRIITENRKLMRPVVKGGRAAIVKREHESLRPYNALVVGLDQERAVKACKQLSSNGAYCLAIAPERLRDRKALWR